MTSNPQWWAEFERQEAIRMEKNEIAHAKLNLHKQILEWDNMVGGASTLEWANPRDWRQGWSEEAWDKNRGW